VIDLKRYFSNLRNRPEAEPSDFKSDNRAAADVMRRNIPVEKNRRPGCLALPRRRSNAGQPGLFVPGFWGMKNQPF